MQQTYITKESRGSIDLKYAETLMTLHCNYDQVSGLVMSTFTDLTYGNSWCDYWIRRLPRIFPILPYPTLPWVGWLS